MVRIPINGLSNGEHPISLVVPATEIEGIFPEFIGDVYISGTLQKTGRKLVIALNVRGTARLTCDYSLELFEEAIEAEFALSFLQDTELYLRRLSPNKQIEDDPYALRILREDDTSIDLTADLAEELSVRLPIRRVAPQFRDMTFAEYVQKVLGGSVRVTLDGTSRADDPWSVLKKIQDNNAQSENERYHN
ncbi:MAG: YceD family protein [Bacteroidota bacterium]|nr:DUF177 domain-containing protein [Candidatus Kapabacteria bacterium]MCS7302007.1 DUF177 domain-containing protein [Candidatus Kapabacteria bacterium]MCX7936807.1 DUF177 domain-containing protein [Chlorobiota bacterium]MDW8074526.1 YceD family protein [Bacteroidota bacterium]MDW8270998.1 YceD family protein [Bacteroidota bacterium]